MRNQWKGFLLGVFATLLLGGAIGTAAATVGTKAANLQYNNIKVTLDGKAVNLVDSNGNPAEPFIIDGTTYLPVRALAGAFGLDVSWDAANSTVVLSSEKSYEVTRVIDGDTIVVNYNGVQETVRMIGIDTPESVHPDKSKNTDAGFAASEFTTAHLTGEKVKLEFDVQQRDQYGRLLAYVYKDGEMFNKKLLMTGYAEIATYPPNVKYVNEFTQIVQNRDPSIPSGEYNDGYMKAPKVVYNTSESKNGMRDAFLYIDGPIKETGKTSAFDYVIITAEHGDFMLFDVSNSGDFRSLKKGSNIVAGFLYVGYSDDVNMGYGAYMEMLSTGNSAAPTTPTAPVSRTVYVTKTGKRYHYDGNCNGGTYIPSTLEDALGRGLTPCEKCVK